MRELLLFRSIPISCIIDESYLAHAVVRQLDVPFVIQQDVVQLQVAVDDALFMQEVQSDADFSRIKSAKPIHKKGQQYF